MGGFSVQCDCGRWFLAPHGYRDHCHSTGHAHDSVRVGASPHAPQKPTSAVEDRLTRLFSAAFATDSKPMLDWMDVRFELKRLRERVTTLENELIAARYSR